MHDRKTSMAWRAGVAALAAMSICAAVAQPAIAAPSAEATQVSSLSATCLQVIRALPADSTTEVYEAQLAATIEASGLSAALVREALHQLLTTKGLPDAAVTAINNLLAKGAHKRTDNTGALGDGSGLGSGGNGGGFGGGGGSDY